MREARDRALCIVITVCAAATGYAQAPEVAPVGTGSVSGHVICADTQRPGRFADIMLVRKPDPAQRSADSGANPAQQVQKQRIMLMAKARTSLDGSYTIRDVPPGDYFVAAKLAGYVGPNLDARGAYDNTFLKGDVLEKAMIVGVTVHVVQDRESIANLMLIRGGAITGTVRFDDGTPLGGGTVKIEQINDSARAGEDPDQSGEDTAVATPMTSERTDDRGVYRATGLPPGKFRVSVDIQIANGLRLFKQVFAEAHNYSEEGSSSQFTHFVVYQPDTLRQSKARVFEVKSDEQFNEADLTVKLDGLHSVTGKVTARGGPCPFIMGIVGVVDDADKSFQRAADLDPDGNFQIAYVPNGTYTLWVNAGLCLRPQADGGVGEVSKDGVPLKDTSRHFKAVSVPVMVADHDLEVNEILVDDLVQPDN